jgi:hypothetical protein
MKVLNAMTAVVLSAFSLPLIGQNQPAPAPSVCGDLRVGLAVTLDNSRHTVAQPVPGKALIYFIQDIGLPALFRPDWTTKAGIDGKWVGANQRNSYFSVPVDPGVHHLCVSYQWRFSPFSRLSTVELAHLTAEAGKSYFYRVTIIHSDGGPVSLILNPVDSDEGKYLVETYPRATAHIRK